MTNQELQVLVALIDAGIRAAGLQVFRDGNGAVLSSALEKLQKLADENDDKPDE